MKPRNRRRKIKKPVKTGRSLTLTAGTSSTMRSRGHVISKASDKRVFEDPPDDTDQQLRSSWLHKTVVKDSKGNEFVKIGRSSGPGPGCYDTGKSLIKKSFNVKIHRDHLAEKNQVISEALKQEELRTTSGLTENTDADHTRSLYSRRRNDHYGSNRTTPTPVAPRQKKKKKRTPRRMRSLAQTSR